jgi:fluoroquinolone transport system permease protein
MGNGQLAAAAQEERLLARARGLVVSGALSSSPRARGGPLMLTVLRNDLRRALRDQFLVGAMTFIVVISVAMRFALPALDLTLREGGGVSLVAYFPLMASYLAAATGGVMTGVIVGMLLLENREQDTISALMVSPLSLARLLVIEAGVAFVGAALVTLFQALVVGVGLPSLGPLVALSLAGALFAPLIMLAIATFATNKLEAFAILKLLSLLALGPAVAYFVDEPWQLLALVFPPYGVMKAWWIAATGAGAYWHWIALGVLVQLLWILLLARRFLRVLRG